MNAKTARNVQVVGYFLGPLLLVGTMFWIALAEQKSWGILMGVVAVVLIKYVYVTLPDRLHDESAGERTDRS
ncbi:MAG: hypothetical protein VX641_06390 [Planctomycetota bacterium]|nr:hypothetical protein [Planctomycetota bacterium]